MMTEQEQNYFATLLRAEAARARESAKIIETVAIALSKPPGDLPEPSRSSHYS